MIKLSDFIQEELVFLDLIPRRKEDIIKALVSAVMKAGLCRSEKILAKVIMDRELLGSTGIGGGVAIPHGKHSSVKEKAVVIGRSKIPIEFNSADGKPARLFFLLISPDTEPGQHLKMLAKISRLIQNDAFREKLMLLPTPRQIIECIKAEEIKT